MHLRSIIVLNVAMLLAGCATTQPPVAQCPVGVPPQQNVNQQVQFNDNGVMYQGQAFAETSQEAELRAKSAAERARQDAIAKGSAYGYFFDCTSQGVSVTVQKPATMADTP